MIRQSISKMIWEKKYQNNNETEDEFYKRIADGLFGECEEYDEEIREYEKILATNDIRELFRHKFANHECSLAGRGLYGVGSGKTQQTFSNCFVQPIKKDSLNAIMEAAREAAMTMKAGGGVGYSISILRPSSVKISSSDSNSSGAVSFLKIFDSTCSVIKAGGDRRGAQLCALGVWHPSIKEFITAKRNGGLTNFNLSVFIPDEFMTAVKNDLDWDLVFPDTKHLKYEEEWDGNIKLWKEKGYKVIIHETVKAKELFDLIMESNYNFAEPGVLFEDTINKKNTLWYDEYIQTTNPCVTGDALVDVIVGGYRERIHIKKAVEIFKLGVDIDILSYNTDEKKNEYNKVTFADMTRKDAKLLRITDSETNKSIKVTPDHLVFTKRGYVRADELLEDDKLCFVKEDI